MISETVTWIKKNYEETFSSHIMYLHLSFRHIEPCSMAARVHVHGRVLLLLLLRTYSS